MYTNFVDFDHFHMLASHKWQMIQEKVRVFFVCCILSHFHIISNVHDLVVFFWLFSRCFQKARTTMGVPGLWIRNRTRPGCGWTIVARGLTPQTTADRLVWAVLHLLLPVSAYEVLALGNFFGWWEVGGDGPSKKHWMSCEGNALAM